MLKRLRHIPVFAITMALLLSSCAKKQEVKPSEPTAPPAAVSEKLVLPEPPAPARPEATEQRQSKPQPFTLEEHAEDKFIILNFEDTDIKTVIATFAELLDMNYILTPGISGSVTIQSYKKFPVSELFSIFQTILEVNGLTAVSEGTFFRIIPIDAAKQSPIEIAKGTEIEYRLDSAFVTQLVPLQFVKASDIKNNLGALMPRGTDIIVYEPANMLIVSALPSNLRKFMKLIEALDISETERETQRTFVYYVENGEAKKLAEILKSVYAEKKESGAAEAAPLQRRVPVPGSPQAASALPAEIGEISITAYDDINALIIKASPQTFLTLLEVLKKLDVPVKQVLIEVLIAQVELKGSNEFGFQWLLSHSGGDTTGFITPGLTEPALPDRKDLAAFTKGQPGGFAYVLTEKNFAAIIKALAKESKLNVMASPHILTMDNREAKIQIGSREPIFTSVQQGTAGTLVQQQIQYIDVGRLLTVRPHITEKNRVTLDLRLEVSAVGSTGTTGSPSFDTKKAETSAAIQSGHTLILGGIISEEKKSSRSGIPFLSKIPILGYLFSSTTEENDKRELILMVTPYVVGSQDEADSLSNDYQERVRVIKEKFGQKPAAPAAANPEAAAK